MGSKKKATTKTKHSTEIHRSKLATPADEIRRTPEMGRPSLFSEGIKNRIIEMVNDGYPDKEIASAVGVNERTYTNWKKRYPDDFLPSLKVAKDVADELVEASLYERACGYSHPTEKIFCQDGVVTRVQTIQHYAPDPTSMIFWLKNRRPERWREKRDVELSGKVESEISQEIKQDLVDQMKAMLSDD